MLKQKRYIVDTTLRDGEQSPGFAFSPYQKVQMAQLLDSLGIVQIEAGIPALGKCEKESIYKMMQLKKRSRISAWNRMSLDDINHSIECCPDIIHICVPVSYIQIYSKLRKNKVWLINQLKECVSFAMEKGFAVSVGFEDASRADITFMRSLLEVLSQMGVRQVRYADTVGVLTPKKSAEAIKDLAAPVELDIEIHVHNDLGMAVANSLEAAKAGAKYIDCTFWGIGERSGNCNIEHFVFTAGHLFDLGIDKYHFREISEELARIVGYTARR